MAFGFGMLHTLRTCQIVNCTAASIPGYSSFNPDVTSTHDDR